MVAFPFAPFAIVIGAPVGIVSAKFTLVFSLFTGSKKKTVKNNNK